MNMYFRCHYDKIEIIFKKFGLMTSLQQYSNHFNNFLLNFWTPVSSSVSKFENSIIIRELKNTNCFLHQRKRKS